ncbi:MAG: DHH family phosphoesterase [Pseudomonadota bacterium]
MAVYDVFNGDADGICALTQLRNADPVESTLVTGVKRDISLLRQIDAQPGDRIYALDISLDKNRDALIDILDAGAEVFYCDHHFAGEIPDSDALTVVINTEPDVCTSILINGHLKGAYLAWAVTGAFGDNLFDSAARLAKPLELSDEELEQLKNLGTYINYNGYGSSLDDLHFAPAELYTLASAHASPFGFMSEGRDDFERLEAGFHDDMSAASDIAPARAQDSSAVFVLPNEPWARRVSGVYSNDLANAHPDRAHAVLTAKANGNYLVSVRAPLNNKTGADELCMRFPTGGGRKAAAGINDLPAEQLSEFMDQLAAFYA